ncbi:MAG: PQQ-binding-like beta-propeller repeat protein [Alphaproteobacteria bacterium]|nr:PQQ-binding-like beta-propeller repeat protein [Alphaproteobacteria bacterium]MDE2336700.1 PQQ-binding-like beta-propeller repeat protein [Alphaproteobacteria bacterium]
MKKTPLKRKLILLAVLPAFLLLGACAKIEGMFSSDDDLPPLKGTRISLLQLQQQLEPSPALQQTPLVLPAPWANMFWPQVGGYPNHVMGQPTLGGNLKEAWKSSIGDGGNSRDPLITQPVVGGGMVFTLDTEGTLAAFDIAGGAKKWHKSSLPKGSEETGGVGGGIAYDGGKLYVTNGYGQLACFDAATGATLWRTALQTPSQSAPTVVNGSVYVVTIDNRLLVFSAADGTATWSYTGVPQTTSLLASISPAADDTAIILPQSSGEILGLNATNGQVLWQDNISAVNSNGLLAPIDDISQPVINQGVVYAASYSGHMVAFNETTGQRLWQNDIGSANMPWVAGDNMFVITTGQKLVALALADGGIRWVTQLPEYQGDDKNKTVVWAGPVLAGGRLLAASSDGHLVEVDPQSGKITRNTELPGKVLVPPVVADNTLLVLTDGGALVAYR